MIKHRRFFSVLLAALGLARPGLGMGDAPTPAAEAGLSDYHTVAQAITTTVVRNGRTPTGLTGYLGVSFTPESTGRLLVEEVEPGSPGASAGVRPGDVLQKLDGVVVPSVAEARNMIQMRGPGERMPLTLERGGKSISVMALLTATSRPMRNDAQRVSLGVRFGDWEQGEGAVLERCNAGSVALEAGLHEGDILLRLDGEAVPNAETARALLEEKSAGDRLRLEIRRRKEEMKIEVRLPRLPNPGENRARDYWRKDTYRLAVIPIEFPDVKHNPEITQADWTDFLFSTNRYAGKENPTGQMVYGSVHDFYKEASAGALRITGRVFDWVAVSRNRGDYVTGSNAASRSPVLPREVLDKLAAREGGDPLADFDGLLFIYAGDRYSPANRGSLYWPHMGALTYRNRRWNMLVCPEGHGRMADISVYCHEFGHLLGWPDLYSRPENPGAEGLGYWCLMSQQTGGGRPQHPSAWCKEQLGWLQPAIIDPTVRQKLVLAPIEGSATECFKILARRDGSEYFLLENRRHTGFDESLPGEGLLIWRVVGNRPRLEAAHGIDGPGAPRAWPTSVPFPCEANHAFTPYTTPTSRSQLGGGLPVYLTNIRRWPDGRISFQVGTEFN